MKSTLSLMLAVGLAACEPGTFSQFSVDGAESARMDASQRVLLVTNRGGREGNRHVVCAEPSPDSLATMSLAIQAEAKAKEAATAAGVGQAEQSASLGSSFSQNAAFIGMRSQTIQLLRDGLYRACEAYMNGAIDEAQYNVLLVNIGRLMVSLVAIDGLTGRPAAPATIVGQGVTTRKTNADGSVEVTTQSTTGGFNQNPALTTGADMAKVADAVRDIAGAANGESSLPALCMSFMASDRYGSPRADPSTAQSPEFNEVSRLCRRIFDRLPTNIRYQTPPRRT